MKDHGRKIVWLAAAVLALSASAADARQQHGSQAQSGMQSQQQSAADTQQRQQQRMLQQDQQRQQQRTRNRARIHAADPAAQGRQNGQGPQARQGPTEGDSSG